MLSESFPAMFREELVQREKKVYQDLLDFL